MVVLGIETTCDETAAAVVERPAEGPGRILSNIVLSQIDEHALERSAQSRRGLESGNLGFGLS